MMMMKNGAKFTLGQKKSLTQMKIGLVYLFGSEAEGFSTPLSDIDLGVVFQDPKIAFSDSRSIYNDLYKFFTEIFRNKKIDIVLLEKAGLELKFDVISHGKVLFEISQEFRFDFEEMVANLYFDFKPILEEFNQALLRR